MPYDFRNVTVPLGQLLFRKRNERWRNEAEDADSARRIKEATTISEAQNAGIAKRQRELLELERELERQDLAGLEAAAGQRTLAGLPVDPITNQVHKPDPTAIAKAAADNRFMVKALGTKGGSSLIRAEMDRELAAIEDARMREIAKDTLGVRQEEARNAKKRQEVDAFGALTKSMELGFISPDQYKIRMEALNRLFGEEALLERLNSESEQKNKQLGVSAGLWERLMGRGPGLPATIQTPETPASVRTIQLPKR